MALQVRRRPPGCPEIDLEIRDNRRFIAGTMKMAEPAEYGLGYLTQLTSLDELWAAHADGRYKFHGIARRVHGPWRALR